MQELKTIRLLGAAGRKFGRSFQLAVHSPAEAIRALGALIPEFHGWILDQHSRGVAWKVVTDRSEGLSEDELKRETGVDQIIFAPVIVGAGGISSGVGKIIAGVALIAVAVFVPAAAIGLKSMFAVGMIGAGLALSGTADLLTPTPQLRGPKATSGSGVATSRVTGVEVSKAADLESNLFSRDQGTGAQGEAVPLVYGRRRVAAPRLISFELRNMPSERDISTGGTLGLVGYVNQTELT